MHNGITVLYTRNLHIINQLYFNTHTYTHTERKWQLSPKEEKNIQDFKKTTKKKPLKKPNLVLGKSFDERYFTDPKENS